LGSRKIPRSFVQELLSQVDIVDIISRYINLKQVGRNFSALCPFHPEKTPSFVVSPEKQIFKCFGCGVGGNAITFVEKYENISFYEAVKRVAEIAGIEVPVSDGEEELEEIEEFGYKAAKFFYSHIGEISDYLAERRIDEKTAEKFLLGYAPKGYGKELGIPVKAAKELGLISRGGKEFFAERLIIPIFSHNGKVIAFAGRVLKGSEEPKYINSPESSLFKKSRTLYGFYQSRDRILKERKVLIVEGYFDVISLHRSGVDFSVAPMGTSLTENHVKIVKRYTQTPLLMFDGDKAGRKAVVRSAGLFLKEGIESLVVPVPEGEDPDSLARKDPELLKNLVNKPVLFLDWLLGLSKELNESELKELLEQSAPFLVQLRISNPFLYNDYLSKLRAEFGIEEEWLKLHSPLVGKREGEKEETLPVPPYEKVFLKTVVEKGELPPIDLSPNIFLSKEVAKVYTFIKEVGERDLFTIQAEYPEVAPLLSEIVLMDTTEEEEKAALCRVLKKELERRLRKEKDLHDKVELKKAIIRLSRGEIDAVKTLKV